MRYKKKPVVVEATQWWKNGDHPDDYSEGRVILEEGEVVLICGEEAKRHDCEGQVVRYFRHPSVPGQRQCKHCGRIMHEHGWIDTLEGGHIVCPGDYIITGVKGERYPCKPNIFDETYEPVKEGAE
jgi:hypothetical protein